jgi:hypothetical protein
MLKHCGIHRSKLGRQTSAIQRSNLEYNIEIYFHSDVADSVKFFLFILHG